MYKIYITILCTLWRFNFYLSLLFISKIFILDCLFFRSDFYHTPVLFFDYFLIANTTVVRFPALSFTLSVYFPGFVTVTTDFIDLPFNVAL